MPARLTCKTWRHVWRLLDVIYAARTKKELLSVFFDEAESLISFDTAVFFPVDPVTRIPSATDHFYKNIADGHKVAKRYGEYYFPLDPAKHAALPCFANKAVKYTDTAPISRIADSEFYRDFLKPAGIANALGSQIWSQGRAIGGVGLHRDSYSCDFSDVDKEVFNLLAPHLANALRVLDLNSVEVESQQIDPCAEWGLTQREREVAQLLGRGLRNHEIARRLFISEQTVKDHLRSIYRKAGVKNRAGLILRLFAPPSAHP